MKVISFIWAGKCLTIFIFNVAAKPKVFLDGTSPVPFINDNPIKSVGVTDLRLGRLQQLAHRFCIPPKVVPVAM